MFFNVYLHYLCRLFVWLFKFPKYEDMVVANRHQFEGTGSHPQKLGIFGWRRLIRNFETTINSARYRWVILEQSINQLDDENCTEDSFNKMMLGLATITCFQERFQVSLLT